MTRLHYLQHEAFEGIGYIRTYAEGKKMSVTGTHVFDNEPFPAIEDFDWLVIMGGSMSVYDQSTNPWMARENKFVERAIAANKTVVGICLGAQVIARVLGARVYPNASAEIGWFPVSLTPDGRSAAVFGGFPGSYMAFHWHGDTFDIPAGALHCARSEACVNQAFVYQKRVVGLQFHCESTEEGIAALINNCRDDASEGRFVQGPQLLQSGMRFVPAAHALLARLLDGLLKMS